MASENFFSETLSALSPQELSKALRSALRRTGAEARKVARAALASTPGKGVKGGARPLGKGTRRAVEKSLRLRLYPKKYGLGFMVTASHHGEKGMHLNRQGRLKPVLFFAAGGTAERTTRRGGKKRGKMPQYPFIPAAEQRVVELVERDTLQNLQAACERELKKRGI